MPVYFMNSYDIINPELFKEYPPKVLTILKKYGAEVIASDVEGVAIEGRPRKMNAIVKFPSAEAAMQCYNDPEYQPIKAIRHKSTANGTMVLVKGYE
jgi:uncharacterized protein (DUF1330 family)